MILQDHMIKEWCRFIKLLKVCYNPDKFSDHSLFENGGLILLICNVTSGDQNFKGLCVFMFVWLWLCFVCLHPAKFDSHIYCGSGDKFGGYIHVGVSLPHDPISTCDWKLKPLYRCDLLTVTHHPVKFCDQGLWKSLWCLFMVSVCHVVAQDHVTYLISKSSSS